MSKILTDTSVKKATEEEAKKKEEKKLKQKNAALVRAKKNLEKLLYSTIENSDKTEGQRHVSKQKKKKKNYISEISIDSENMSFIVIQKIVKKFFCSKKLIWIIN